jgi:hypothetical protein
MAAAFAVHEWGIRVTAGFAAVRECDAVSIIIPAFVPWVDKTNLARRITPTVFVAALRRFELWW